MKELRRIRNNSNMTQREMAELLGISKSYYCKLEQGTKLISRGFLLRMKQHFPDVSIDTFFE